MLFTDLLLHPAWDKCWNDNAAVAAVVVSGPELFSSSSFSCTSFSWCSSCRHHRLYAWGGAEQPAGQSCKHTDAPARRSRVKARERGRVNERGDTETEREREGRAQWKSEAMRVSFLVFGWRYHAGHFCRGLWEQTQLNTQRVNRDPRSLFFSHRGQRCVFAPWWTGDLCRMVPCFFGPVHAGKKTKAPTSSKPWEKWRMYRWMDDHCCQNCSSFMTFSLHRPQHYIWYIQAVSKSRGCRLRRPNL